MIAAGLLYLGLFALAASMSRHADLLPPHWRPGRSSLQGVAWFLILLSLAAALWSSDWPMRLITWIGLAPLAAGLILLGLTYGVRWARIAAALAAVLVVAGVIAGG